MLNQVVLVGRVKEKPKVHTTENDKTVISVLIGVERSLKNADGVHETDFIKCVLWNDSVDTIKWCRKGDLIGVKGRIQTSRLGKKDSIEVIVEKFSYFLSESQLPKKQGDK